MCSHIRPVLFPITPSIRMRRKPIWIFSRFQRCPRCPLRLLLIAPSRRLLFVPGDALLGLLALTPRPAPLSLPSAGLAAGLLTVAVAAFRRLAPLAGPVRLLLFNPRIA